MATIHQRVDENGEVHMDVEPPSDEETDSSIEKPNADETSGSQSGAIESQILPNIINTSADEERNSTVVQHFIINPSNVKP